MASASTTLPPVALSVPEARRFVRRALTELGAAGACEDAETLVSELATNAVLHARTAFTVEVSRDGAVVRVCVLDLSPKQPRERAYGTGSTTGRGIRLVASVASDWGVSAQGVGKTVWFEVPAGGGLTAVPAWEDHVDVDVLLASFDDGEDAAPPSSPQAAA